MPFWSKPVIAPRLHCLWVYIIYVLHPLYRQHNLQLLLSFLFSLLSHRHYTYQYLLMGVYNNKYGSWSRVSACIRGIYARGHIPPNFPPLCTVAKNSWKLRMRDAAHQRTNVFITATTARGRTITAITSTKDKIWFDDGTNTIKLSFWC